MNLLNSLLKLTAKPYPTLLPEVLRDFPEFNRAAVDEWQTVTLLRRWAYRHVRRALSRSCLLDKDETFHYYSKGAPEIFEAFRQELGGVWCGGVAHALMMLYRHFGFISHSVDMGIPTAQEFPGLSHVATLVEINQQGQAILSLQDAYFNISYIDQQSQEPLDYFDLLTRLNLRQHEQIVMAGLPNENTINGLKEPGEELTSQLSWSVNKSAGNSELTATGLLKESRVFTWELFVQRNAKFKQFKEWLSNKGYPSEAIYLLAFPFAIYGKHPKANHLLKKAQTIVAAPESAHKSPEDYDA